MRLVTLFMALSLMTGFSAKAQDESLPDLPIMDESAPKEPPFTQPNEFDEAQKLENEATTPGKVPVESAPIVQKPAGTPAPSQTKIQAPPDLPKRKNAKQGVDRIEHPLAAKGLIRIEKDGSYIYEVKHAEHTQTAILRVGSIQPPNIEAAGGVTDYKTMYSSGNVPVFMFDYEWQPFHSMGKLGVQTGFGLFSSTGNGHFLTMTDGTTPCTTPTGECQAREKYTFIALPLNLGLVYRFEFTDHQWVAPYVAGGGSYYILAENRDDDKSLHGVGTPGAYGAGGLMFNISAWDRETAYSLNSEYGITNLWVSLEYRYIKTFSNDLDLTSGMINVGIAVDY